MKSCGFLRLVVLCFVVVFLSACGGSVPGPSNPLGGNKLSLDISSDHIDITANKLDSTPVSPVITLTASGGKVYVDSSSTSNGIYGHTLDCPNTSTCTLTADPMPPSSLNLGVYHDTITVRGCEDSGCNSVIATYTVAVTYTIKAGGSFNITPNALDVTTPDGVAQAPVNLSLSYSNGVSTSWDASINYISGSDWLTLSAMTGSTSATSNLTATFNVMPVGSYQAEVTFTSSGGDVSLTLPVTYTVKYIRTVPSQLSFLVNLATGVTQSQQVTVTHDFGAESSQSSVDWSATSTANWLSMTPSIGDTATNNQFTVALIPAQLQTMNDGVYTTQVTLTSSDPNVADVTIPVQLNLNMPRVTSVTPYLGYTGVSDNVVLRGTGFTGITASNITFGASAAVSVESLDDTAVRVVYPSLTAGDYSISVADAFGTANTSSAQLKIQDAPVLPDVDLSRSGTVERVVYDEQRQTIYVADSTNDAIERYYYNGTNWKTDSLAMAGIPFDMALTKDGQQLLVLLTANIVHINPDTFSITTTIPRPISITNSLDRIATLNDDNALIALNDSFKWPYLYDVNTHSFSAITAPGFNGFGTDLASSADGQHVYVSTFNSGVVNYLSSYDASTESITVGPSIGTVTSTKTTRKGDKVIINRGGSFKVYDAGMNYLGQLPLADLLFGAVLSPDGAYAYGYIDSGTSPTLKTYDLSKTNSSGEFTSTSTLTLTNSLGTQPDMTISADGKILILAGDRFVVKNLP